MRIFNDIKESVWEWYPYVLENRVLKTNSCGVKIGCATGEQHIILFPLSEGSSSLRRIAGFLLAVGVTASASHMTERPGSGGMAYLIRDDKPDFACWRDRGVRLHF